jgi:membrane protein implicated in regulation of membrane protease activity
MRRLTADGTVRIQRAIGEQATVYVPIAARQKRAGKVHLKLQDRLVEYEAVTSADEPLPTGARVRVVGLIGNRLEVEPLPEHEAVAS